MRVVAVVPGPDTHGVVRHALEVARLVGAEVVRDLRPVVADVVHVPFTDALWGPDIAAAAAAFEAWASTVGAPVVVTLHDVPGADRDPARDARRRAGYDRVVAASRAAVVCSAAEARRLTPRPAVIPLPVERLPSPGPVPAWTDRPSLGVLGFVYPGKGHERALEAAAGTGARVVALGAVTPGHEPLLAGLHERAHELGVELLVTGTLTDADLHAGARAVTVPVAAYATTGASASLLTWLTAGRRPVATAGPYADELLRTRPGCLLPATDLAAAVRGALADPAATWGTLPDAPDVAGLHRAVFASVLR